MEAYGRERMRRHGGGREWRAREAGVLAATVRRGDVYDRYLDGVSSSTPEEIGGTRSKALEADVVGTWATCACAGGAINGIVPCLGESLPPPPPPLAAALSPSPSPQSTVAGVCELNRGAELLTGVVLLSGACNFRDPAARTDFGEVTCLTGSPRRLRVMSPGSLPPPLP